jgi:hypothetical protein
MRLRVLHFSAQVDAVSKAEAGRARARAWWQVRNPATGDRKGDVYNLVLKEAIEAPKSELRHYDDGGNQ